MSFISAGIKANIEIDYEEYIADGYRKAEAIKVIAKEWLMTYQEVSDIINAFEGDMLDNGKNQDLGDII